MRSNYKLLGQYIQMVDIRNRQLEVKTLLGVSVKKIFIPSIANTVGTDFKKYKIVKRNQFTYIPDTSRRGDKIGLAMLSGHEIALVSQAYTVFEIINHEELNPEYLMMWFRRPEFDRYARFKSHGSVREIFDWNEMCEVELPIPSIEKQREIVKEYNTIVNRIKLNEQLNQKLEETAQALYKHWFVDFEFPNDEGVPYKSSGGKMVYNEELDMEIPEEWSYKTLETLTKQICVAFVGSVYKFYCEKDKGIPMLRTTDITKTGLSYKDLRYVTNEFHQKQKKSQLTKGDLLVARHGSNGMPVIFDQDFEANALNVIIIKPESKLISSKMIHCFLNSDLALNHIKSSLGGSVQEVLNTKKIADLKIVYPETPQSLSSLFEKIDAIQIMIEKKRKAKYILEELLEISSKSMLRSEIAI